MVLGLNGNTGKTIRFMVLALPLVVFILAQGKANGTKSEQIHHNIDRIDRQEKAILETQDDIEQIKLDVNSIQGNMKNAAEDMSEMKKDMKEFIKIQTALNNKFMEHIIRDENN